MNLHKSISVIPSVKPADVIPSLGQRLLDSRITKPDLKNMPKVAIIPVHDWGTN